MSKNEIVESLDTIAIHQEFIEIIYVKKFIQSVLKLKKAKIDGTKLYIGASLVYNDFLVLIGAIKADQNKLY